MCLTNERVKGSPPSAGNTVPRVIHNAAAFLCCEDTFLVHVQCGVHQDLQVLLCQTTFQLFGPKSILEHWVIAPHGEDWGLPFV